MIFYGTTEQDSVILLLSVNYVVPNLNLQAEHCGT